MVNKTKPSSSDSCIIAYTSALSYLRYIAYCGDKFELLGPSHVTSGLICRVVAIFPLSFGMFHDHPF